MDKGAKQLSEWMEFGVFDALSKNFLKSIYFNIYSSPERRDEQLLESYRCE